MIIPKFCHNSTAVKLTNRSEIFGASTPFLNKNVTLSQSTHNVKSIKQYIFLTVCFIKNIVNLKNQKLKSMSDRRLMNIFLHFFASGDSANVDEIYDSFCRQ